MHEHIHGIVPPMTTPFRPDDTLDEEALRAETRYLIETARVHGLAVGGSTGQPAGQRDALPGAPGPAGGGLVRETRSRAARPSEGEPEAAADERGGADRGHAVGGPRELGRAAEEVL